jgi:hypothetical protein
MALAGVYDVAGACLFGFDAILDFGAIFAGVWPLAEAT